MGAKTAPALVKQKINLAVTGHDGKTPRQESKKGGAERKMGDICRPGGGFLGVAGSACEEDSSAKNTQRFFFCCPLRGLEVEVASLRRLTSPLSGRSFLKGTAEV